MRPLHHGPAARSHDAGPTFISLAHRSNLLNHSNDICQRIRAAGFEPAISSSPSLRIGQAFPRPGRGRPGFRMTVVERSARTMIERGAARCLKSKRPGSSRRRASRIHERDQDGPGVNSAESATDGDSQGGHQAAQAPVSVAMAVDSCGPRSVSPARSSRLTRPAVVIAFGTGETHQPDERFARVSIFFAISRAAQSASDSPVARGGSRGCCGRSA